MSVSDQSKGNANSTQMPKRIIACVKAFFKIANVKPFSVLRPMAISDFSENCFDFQKFLSCTLSSVCTFVVAVSLQTYPLLKSIAVT